MWKLWVILGVFYMAFGFIMIWTASKHLDRKLGFKEKTLKLYSGGRDGPSAPTATLRQVRK